MAGIVIQPHESQAGIRTASGGSAAQYRSARDFMTPGQENLGRGMQQLAAGMEKLGNVMFDAEIQKRQEQMELTLLEDMQGFQSESQAWTDNYQQQNQGKNAVNAETDASAFYKEKIDSLRQRWAGNERALLHIQRTAGNMAISGVNAMRDYGNRQQEAWKDSVFAGKKVTFDDVASDWRSTPEEIQSAYASFAPANNAYLTSKGMDPTSAQVATDRAYRDAMSARRESGYVEKLNSGNLAGAAADLKAMQGGDAANFSAQYESGTAGSFAIGYDKNGGTSYGKFQISSKAGTFDSWLQWLDKNGYQTVSEELRAAGDADTGSRAGKAPDVWRALVQAGEITEDMQARFVNETIVDPALNNLPESMRESVQDDPALMRAFFSTAVQHGSSGAAKLFTRNWGKGGEDKEAFLDALTADRKTQFRSSEPEVQAAVAARLDRERATVGAAVVNPEKIRAYQKMLQTAVREKVMDDAITRYSGLPPDQAARAALQDPALTQDRETQRKVVGYFDWQASQEEGARKREQLEQLNQSYDDVSRAAESGNVRDVNRIIMAATPENQAKLQTYANRVMNGDGLVSDPVSFDDMVARINDGQPVKVEAEYGDVLSLKDLRRGKDMVSRRDLAEYRVQEKVAFEEEAKKYKPKITSTEQSSLFRQFEASIPEGGYKSPEQRQKALTAFWRKITVDRPWSFSKEIRGFQEKKFAGEGYYPSTGAEYQQLVTMAKAQIKARDGVERQPTEEELIRLYQQIQGVPAGGAK